MNSPALVFWAGLIGACLAWYGFLVVFLGWRAGKELRELIHSLRARRLPPEPPEESAP